MTVILILLTAGISNGQDILKTEIDRFYKYLLESQKDRERYYKNIKNLYSVIEKRCYFPDIYPCTGRISSEFGLRMHPILKIVRKHNGIDISNKIGTPIYSTTRGRVINVGFDKNGYGLYILVDSGVWKLRYAHLSKSFVEEGDIVGKGEIIGLMGDSGLCTGPHLHYEIISIYDGPIDPMIVWEAIEEGI